VVISGLELSQSLEKHAKAYGKGIVDFKEGAYCTRIEKNDLGFKIYDSADNSYEARAILITAAAAGASWIFRERRNSSIRV